MRPLLITISLSIAFALLSIEGFAQSTLYGTVAQPNGNRALIEIDQTTGAGTLIGSTGTTFQPMHLVADNNNGILFGVRFSGELYILNTSNGLASLVNPVNITAPAPKSGINQVITDAAFNDADGKIYALVQTLISTFPNFDVDLDLVTIDATTGDATVLKTFTSVTVSKLIIDNGTAYVVETNPSFIDLYPIDLNTGILGSPIRTQDFVNIFSAAPGILSNDIYAVRPDVLANYDLLVVDPATGLTTNTVGRINSGALAGNSVESLAVFSISATPVPTVGQWGLIMLGLCFSIMGITTLRSIM